MSRKPPSPPNAKKEGPKEPKEKAAGPIATVPLLNYVSGKVDKNNYTEWLPKMELHLAGIHGEASYSLISGELWSPPEIPLPVILDEDPALVRRRKEETYLTLNKDRDKQIIKLGREIYPSFFGAVWNQMTTTSQDRVRMCAGDSYAAMMRTKNFAELVKFVKQAHLGATKTVSEEDKRRVCENFSRLRQYASESLSDFKLRFDTALETYDAVGEPRPSEERLAVEYISKLDTARFGGMRADLENQRALRPKRDPTPKTVAAAHELASSWKMPFYKDAQGVEHPVFYSEEEKTFKSPSKPPAGAGGKEKGDKKEKETEKESGAKGRGANPKEKGKKSKGKGLSCFICSSKDHLMKDCPFVSEAKALAQETLSTPALVYNGDASTLVLAFKSLNINFIGLDSMSGAHVFHNAALLSDIQDSTTPIRLRGIGGTITASKEGSFNWHGETIRVYLQEESPANLFSYALLREEADRIEYDFEVDEFKVTYHGRALTFRRYGAIYACDTRDCANSALCSAMETIAGNEQLYSKAEVARARKAKALSAKLGYPSIKDYAKMVRTGVLPSEHGVTVADIHRAQRIYGPDLASVRGKTTARKPDPVNPERIPRVEVPSGLNLHVDIMFVEGLPFLLAVATPIYYCMAQYLVNRTYSTLRSCLLRVIDKVKLFGFHVRTIFTDGEGGVMKMSTELEALGIRVNPTAKESVPLVEMKIKQIKERVRGINAVSPYKICLSFMVWLVYYVVSRINMVPSSAMSAYISPTEALTGRKVSFKDTSLSFGQYVEVHERNDVINNLTPRTRGAIALGPRGTLQGSQWFYVFDTGKLIARDRWTEMPMPDTVIAYMNAKAAKQRPVRPDPTFRLGDRIITLEAESEADLPDAEPTRLVGDRHNEESLNEDLERLESSVPHLSDIDDRPSGPTLEEIGTGGMPPGPDEGIITAESSTGNSSSILETDGEEPEPDASQPGVQDETFPAVDSAPTPGPRRSGRERKSVRFYEPETGEWHRDELGLHVSAVKAIGSFGAEAIKSMCKELLQQHTRGVFKPVLRKKLTPTQRRGIIRSSVFLKEKYSSTGVFEKLKSRLVAGGHMQDKSLYDDSEMSSPTASLSSVYMVAAIAAAEGRSVATMDIGGAYLNADIKRDVFMSLEPRMATLLSVMLPEYKPFINNDGTLVVQLKKALYGLVESSELWFQKLTGDLKALGFVANDRDRCVLNKTIEGKQCTLVIYVDDILISCEYEGALTWLRDELRKIYGDVSFHSGSILSYLGQTFDFSTKSKVKVTMENYVHDLLTTHPVSGTAVTPAVGSLFEIDQASDPLSAARAKEYHTIAAKFLYLAKRVRPDLLTATSFLVSRASKATVQDWAKLERLQKYLNGTKDLGIVLEASLPIGLTAYVDASYAVHHDCKSHTGIVLTLGKGPIFVKSVKQKLVTKSSTEAELVAVSDASTQIIWAREFLQSQGYEVGAAVIKEDNIATITLANKGVSTSERTRHIGVRYFFIKDRIDAKEIVMEHLSTRDMIADLLTKALQGELFRKLRELLLNVF